MQDIPLKSLGPQADISCFACGAIDWEIGKAFLGLMGTDLRAQCDVTKCKQCGWFYMTDPQIDAALNQLMQPDDTE